MSWPPAWRSADSSEPTPKIGDADEQRAAPAVAVAEGAGGQEEGGQRDGVGVDDPLLLGLRRVQGAGQIGQGHVEHGRAGHHQDQRTAHRGQDQIAAPGGQERGLRVVLARTGAFLESLLPEVMSSLSWPPFQKSRLPEGNIS